MTAKDLNITALSAVIIAVCSWISFPLIVPVTLQTFGIFTVVGIIGLKKGTAAVVLYLLLGAAGLPVFSGFKGGIGVLFGPTGGYLIGFVAAAIILGWLVESCGRKSTVLAAGMALGLAACYLLGTIWFKIVYTHKIGTVDLLTVLSWCVLPFLIPDVIKITLSIVVVKRVYRLISRS